MNSQGWGDAPEHLLCGLFRASMHLRTPAQSRVIRAVCKRWRVAHDSVMDKLKPGRWSLTLTLTLTPTLTLNATLTLTLNLTLRRWWEGPRQHSMASSSSSSGGSMGSMGMGVVVPTSDGEVQVEVDSHETPSWAVAPPTVMSLLQRFHQLTCIDFSSAEVSP